MHTLNFMWHGFRFPRYVFWGFKPLMPLESKGFGAKSPSCCMAYAIFTYLGAKGTGINRLQGLVFILLTLNSPRQMYL